MHRLRRETTGDRGFEAEGGVGVKRWPRWTFWRAEGAFRLEEETRMGKEASMAHKLKHSLPIPSQLFLGPNQRWSHQPGSQHILQG